jgi:hypothetical protein
MKRVQIPTKWYFDEYRPWPESEIVDVQILPKQI